VTAFLALDHVTDPHITQSYFMAKALSVASTAAQDMQVLGLTCRKQEACCSPKHAVRDAEHQASKLAQEAKQHQPGSGTPTSPS